MSFVVFVNGLLLLGLGTLMLGNSVFFVATRQVFFEAGVLSVFAGTCLVLSTSSSLKGLHRLHTFVLTASVWLTAAAAGALPLWMWHLTATDAFFEAMSGITTTGSTVMTGLDSTPRGILLWRALLQWIGGIGFVVTGIALLPILRVGGMQLFRTESSEKGEKEMARAARFASATVSVYLGLTLCCALFYLAGGMTEFEALVHAMTTLSTGGYSTSDASFGHFSSGFLEWSGTFFMLAGGLPFAWYIRVYNTGQWQSEQVQALVGGLAVSTLALTLWLVIMNGMPFWDTLRHVAFNIVSVVTTTGFASTDYTLWGPLAVAVFFFLTIVGGCTGSTAGGAKVMRWLVTLRAARAKLISVRYPHSLTTVRYENRPLDRQVISGIMAFLTIYAVTISLLAMILGLYGLDLLTSVSGAATAVANVGPGVGTIIGPAGNFTTLPDGAKWFLSFGMYAGRLELMTVFVLFTPMFWRELV